MITLSLAAAALQASPMVAIRVQGREYLSVAGATTEFSGRCDGRAIAVSIASAQRGKPALLVLRAGRVSRRVAEPFLGGRLSSGGFVAAGIGCDGTRMKFRARAAYIDPAGDVAVEAQSVTMDMRSGEIAVAEPTRLSPEEVRLELMGVD